MDPVTFTLILVRHGQTVNNMLQLVQGQKLNARLNRKGREQAIALGRSLKDISFTHVYCSDLKRAEQTCRIILSENNKLRENEGPDDQRIDKYYVKDERIRERYMGCLEGKPICELRKLAKENHQHRRVYTPNDGETTSHVAQRAELFFRSLCELVWLKKTQIEDKCAEDTKVVVVTHSGTIRGFLKMLNENYWCRLPLNINNLVCCNTCVTHIEVKMTRIGNNSSHANYDISTECKVLFKEDHLTNLKRKSSC